MQYLAPANGISDQKQADIPGDCTKFCTADVGTIKKIQGKRGIRWRAWVGSGAARESKRFDTRPEAAHWVMLREAEILRDSRLHAEKTIGDALERYGIEYSAKKRGERAERIRIKRLKRDAIAGERLSTLTCEVMEAYQERRLKEIKPNSVIREMTLIKSAVRKAVRWKWIDIYPLADMENVSPDRARTRVYDQDEIDRLVIASGADQTPIVSQTQQVGVMFLLALETAMRQAEICGLTWNNVYLDKRYVHVPVTKNGEPRNVPLTARAVDLIKQMPQDRDQVFTVSANTTSTLFRRIRHKAGVEGATFHDARRCATIKLSKKLDVLELARACGWKDIKMLLTYYQRDASELAKKLD